MTRALALTVALIAGQAGAHDWYSDTGCCGGYDCEAISADDYSDTGRGYLIHETGEVIPYGEVRQSPNEAAHRCVYLAGDRVGHTRRSRGRLCFWLPGGGV